MKGKIFEAYLLVILIILLLLPHLFSFDNSYVDIEPLYVQSASEIAEHGFNANLSQYFNNIANPVFTSLILSASYKLFGESPVISRLTIFLLAFLFSLFLYFYLRKREGGFEAFVPTLLVIVNPLFIVYSQYVHTDVPFMVFSSTALLLLVYANSSKGKILSSIMLGISLATKYVAVILFPIVLIYSLIKSKIFSQFSRIRLFHFIRFNLWYFALALLVSAPVISIVFKFLNGILVPEQKSLFALNAGMFIPHFFAYLMWLGLFIGPFAVIFVFDLWKRIGKMKFFMLLIGIVALTLTVLFFFSISSLHILDANFGEMNLCGIEPYVPEPYLSVALFFVLLAAEIFIASITLDLKHTRNDKIIDIFLWILIPIVLMSLTRAANRYMLTVLVPLSLYMSFVTKRVYSERTKLFVPVVLALHTLIFLSLGFYANY